MLEFSNEETYDATINKLHEEVLQYKKDKGYTYAAPLGYILEDPPSALQALFILESVTKKIIILLYLFNLKLHSQTDSLLVKTMQDSINSIKPLSTKMINRAPLYKCYIYADAWNFIRGGGLHFELNIKNKLQYADYFNFFIGFRHDVEWLKNYPELQGEYLGTASVNYVLIKRKKKINYEFSFGPNVNIGDPVARESLVLGYSSSKFLIFNNITLALRYTFPKIPLVLRLSGSTFFAFGRKEVIPLLPSLAVGYGFKKMNNLNNVKMQVNRSAQVDKKDNILFYDYYLSANLISRIGVPFDIGIERIKNIKGNLFYASQISVTTNLQGLYLAPQQFHIPAYYGVLVQPFHILIGGDLKFETGVSAAFLFFRYKGMQYPIDTVRITNSYNLLYDRMPISFTAGLRYTFKKSQISIKCIYGLRYLINLQRNAPSYFNFNPGSAELGLNWRFRKRKADRYPKK